MVDLADLPTLPALYNYGKTRFKLFVIYLIGVYITLHRITKILIKMLLYMLTYHERHSSFSVTTQSHALFILTKAILVQRSIGAQRNGKSNISQLTFTKLV